MRVRAIAAALLFMWTASPAMAQLRPEASANLPTPSRTREAEYLTVPPAPSVPSAPAPAPWTDEELRPADPYAPLPPPPLEERRSIGPAYLGAAIGQLVGLALGAAMGAVAFDATRCAPDLSAAALGGDPTASCARDRLMAIGIGAMLLSPLGTAAGAVAGGQLAGQEGSAGDPFWAAAASWILGVVAVPVWGATEDDLAALVAAHVAGNAFSSWFAAEAFDGRWVVSAQVDPDAVVLHASGHW